MKSLLSLTTLALLLAAPPTGCGTGSTATKVSTGIACAGAALDAASAALRGGSWEADLLALLSSATDSATANCVNGIAAGTVQPSAAPAPVTTSPMTSLSANPLPAISTAPSNSELQTRAQKVVAAAKKLTAAATAAAAAKPDAGAPSTAVAVPGA